MDDGVLEAGRIASGEKLLWVGSAALAAQFLWESERKVETARRGQVWKVTLCSIATLPIR